MIDATVVIGGIARGDLVVTSDRTDIEHLTNALASALDIVDI